jgi:hypothetical protein
MHGSFADIPMRVLHHARVSSKSGYRQHNGIEVVALGWHQGYGT